MPLSPKLENLIRDLDKLGPRPSDLEVARIVNAAPLAIEDVAPFIRSNPRGYNRAYVARRDHYELLVMTWLPGQASPPHDHGGSAGVIRVLQGAATESSCAIAPDGYAETQYEDVHDVGAISAFQDSGVHMVHNAARDGSILVTLHAYAPPLKGFHSFAARPGAPARTATASAPTVAVVGGGFSGAMVAAHLLRKANGPLRVALIERRGALGEGVAYSTREHEHLLNVPAKNMSVWPDRPTDLVEWVRRHKGRIGPDDFIPRHWYGEYIRDSLLQSAKDAHDGGTFDIVFDEARRLVRAPQGGWLVHLDRGPSLAADKIVLATGHCAPSDPIGAHWSGPRARYVADPWRPFALNALRPDEPAVILGSGLTGVDAVLSLCARERTAPITLVSLKGLAPQGHASPLSTPQDISILVEGLLKAPGGLRAFPLFRALRQAAKEAMARGGDWRSVVDGVRPHTAAIWQALPLAERRRFLSRLRPFWEVHRHRTAPEVHERLQRLMAEGKVKIVAGRVLKAQAHEAGVQLTIFDRKLRQPLEMQTGWIVNCTGPTPANHPEANPVIGSLLLQGYVR
ncbi:MAG TPA: FAD/NAD(P)-binding protein, partial [Rhodoblastus sp.]|nr:FAD/NAD(P)-binding protein [Rhodoblastus sp.]